jgi:hypothetical protein
MLKIFARVESLGCLNNCGIDIVFYGNMTDGSNFNLRLPYTNEGILKLDISKVLKTNKDITPQYFIDMGKVYEKVKNITSNQVVELIEKVSKIEDKFNYA